MNSDGLKDLLAGGAPDDFFFPEPSLEVQMGVAQHCDNSTLSTVLVLCYSQWNTQSKLRSKQKLFPKNFIG